MSRKGNWACVRCLGTGSSGYEIVKCPILTDSTITFCAEGHLEHYEYKRCWLCFGSGRCDVVTYLWRRYVGKH
jgi:hypothetical protein